jgi:lysozyme
MEITKLDQAGIDFIIKEEGVILHPYKDSVGVPTIGCGMTYYPATGKKVTMADPPITLNQAKEMFAQIVKPYELAVYSTTRDDITQNEFNAQVSLAYNIGVGAFKGSTVHRLCNAGVKAFLKWSKAGGKPILRERRVREYNLYIKP